MKLQQGIMCSYDQEKGCWDGSMGTDACCQCWEPEFSVQDLHGKKNQLLQLGFTSTCVLWHALPPPPPNEDIFRKLLTGDVGSLLGFQERPQAVTEPRESSTVENWLYPTAGWRGSHSFTDTGREHGAPAQRQRALSSGWEDPVSLVLPSASSASQPQRDGDSGWPYMCKPWRAYPAVTGFRIWSEYNSWVRNLSISLKLNIV